MRKFIFIAMHIERFINSDVSSLLEIFNAARSASEYFDGKIWNIAEFLQAIDGEIIHVARVEEKLVAFATVWTPDSFLHQLYVLPEYQRRGIGRQLLARCVKEFGLPISLKCLGAVDIHLDS